MHVPVANLSPARRLLTPLSSAYAGLIRLRNRRFDRVPAASRAAAVPVISVGNLTVGGTGKTPLVIELARRLAERRRPAILTRGYGAPRGGVADEVREFGLAVPQVPVVVEADRWVGAQRAVRDHGADCLLLDDGFQHRRLRRDLDIVVIDALDPWGGGRVLPAGRLREPLESLARADWIVLSRSNQVDAEATSTLLQTLRAFAPQAPVTKAAVACERLAGVNGTAACAEALAARRLLPVCGIGNPQTFLRLLADGGAELCPPLLFGDHRRYSRADVRRIAQAAQAGGAAGVVTTRKDWVKLQELWPAEAPAGIALLRLDARLVLADPHGEFAARLAQAVEVGHEHGARQAL